jgi:hypothetical protein
VRIIPGLQANSSALRLACGDLRQHATVRAPGQAGRGFGRRPDDAAQELQELLGRVGVFEVERDVDVLVVVDRLMDALAVTPADLRTCGPPRTLGTPATTSGGR